MLDLVDKDFVSRVCNSAGGALIDAAITNREFPGPAHVRTALVNVIVDLLREDYGHHPPTKAKKEFAQKAVENFPYLILVKPVRSQLCLECTLIMFSMN